MKSSFNLFNVGFFNQLAAEEKPEDRIGILADERLREMVQDDPELTFATKESAFDALEKIEQGLLSDLAKKFGFSPDDPCVKKSTVNAAIQFDTYLARVEAKLKML